MIGIESGKLFACAAFVRTTVVTIIPSPLQRLHGFGYNGIVRIHLSTWLVFQLEGSVHSVPRDVTLPSLDKYVDIDIYPQPGSIAVSLELHRGKLKFAVGAFFFLGGGRSGGWFYPMDNSQE